jgi:hypothetical protein
VSRCFFHDFAPAGLRECYGPVQAHHAIKEQTIRRLFPKPPLYATDEEIRELKKRQREAERDPRVLLNVCKRHHDAWHSHRRDEFSLTRDDLPEGLELFAAEHGLEHELDRQFGVGFVPEEATP